MGIRPEDPTIATALKNLGYATGQFGKNHLGDRDEFLPTRHGNLYHVNAEEEPELYDYPSVEELPDVRKNFGPRGVIHSWANGDGTQRVEDTGPLTRERMKSIDDEILPARRFMTEHEYLEQFPPCSGEFEDQVARSTEDSGAGAGHRDSPVIAPAPVPASGRPCPRYPRKVAISHRSHEGLRMHTGISCGCPCRRVPRGVSGEVRRVTLRCGSGTGSPSNTGPLVDDEAARPSDRGELPSIPHAPRRIALHLPLAPRRLLVGELRCFERGVVLRLDRPRRS